MTINCKGKILNFDSPIVMGILNVTPDSFFDGNPNLTQSDILLKVDKMLVEGSSIIDIGGYSSRPGAKSITLKEELERVIPAVKLLVKNFTDIIISVDTFRSKVAQKAIEAGASIINDITAGEGDEKMFEVVKNKKVPYVIMHMQGTPSTMQNNPTYKNITKEVYQYLGDKIVKLHAMGVCDVIIDLGFGFGKTIEHNYELLSKLSFFKTLNVPILTGISRKSMIYKVLKIKSSEALNGTTALNMVALQNGSNILRVHDVKEAVECVKMFKQLNNKK